MLSDAAELRVAVVVIALALLAGVAFLGGVGWLLERFRRRRMGRWERQIAAGAWVMSGMGAVAFAYGTFVEPFWLDVSRDNVVTPNLKDGVRYRIVHISDLHVEGPNKLLGRLAGEITALRPDLVIFTGDAVNDPGAVETFRKVLLESEAKYGRFAVRGNHDLRHGESLDLFGDGAAIELQSSEPVIVAGGRIALCGAPYGDVELIDSCLRRAPSSAFKLVAYHSPDLIEELKIRPDLYLAGHTHGGQVRIPKYGALMTLSKFDKKYEMGRYEVDGTILYVNRGIGLAGEGFPPIRFGARPEIAVIDIVGRK